MHYRVEYLLASELPEAGHSTSCSAIELPNNTASGFLTLPTLPLLYMIQLLRQHKANRQSYNRYVEHLPRNPKDADAPSDGCHVSMPRKRTDAGLRRLQPPLQKYNAMGQSVMVQLDVPTLVRRCPKQCILNFHGDHNFTFDGQA